MKDTLTIKVTGDDGTVYDGTIMTVKSTAITYEDHGILTAWLNCQSGSSGIGVGGYCLDEPKDRDGRDYERRGTAYGLDHLIRIIETAGCSSWEDIKGKDVIVLYPENESGLGAMAVGIAGLTNGKVFDLKKHAEAWRDSVAVSA